MYTYKQIVGNNTKCKKGYRRERYRHHLADYNTFYKCIECNQIFPVRLISPDNVNFLKESLPKVE